LPPERWSDDRIDDLAGQVRTVAGLSTQVGVQAANIDALEDAMKDLKDLLVEVRDECRKSAEAAARQREQDRRDALDGSRWTKGQLISAAGPFLAAAALVIAILQGG
jgi:uncharacterized coiled-coil protein SlyX